MPSAKPKFKRTENMKTKSEIALTSGVETRRNLSARKTVVSLVLVTAMIPAIAADGPSTASKQDPTSIRPFNFHAPEEALTDLRRRLVATQWPEKETVTDASQGVPLATMRELARYWATDYDWRKCEAKLNALPQFITEIDGLDIHF